MFRRFRYVVKLMCRGCIGSKIFDHVGRLSFFARWSFQVPIYRVPHSGRTFVNRSSVTLGFFEEPSQNVVTVMGLGGQCPAEILDVGYDATDFIMYLMVACNEIIDSALYLLVFDPAKVLVSDL